MPPRRWSCTVVLVFHVAMAVGCDAPVDRFPPNLLFAQVVSHTSGEDPARALAEIRPVIESLFGTPDAPLLPEPFLSAEDRQVLHDLIDLERIGRAAGPISSDREGVNFGIYRAQCVVCHDLAGGGTGPAAALQNPYPRDFRAGVFKYKSTPRGAKPTREDLGRVLLRGLVGTGMPSFATLPEQDLEALVDYVIYLSLRGEFERRVLAWAMLEADGSETLISEPVRSESSGALAVAAAEEVVDAVPVLHDHLTSILSELLGEWRQAESLAVPSPPEWNEVERAAAAERGRALFHGPLANCASCHGTNGKADVITLDFDDWTKEFTTRLGISPFGPDVKPMRATGALRPRAIAPRNLSWGGFRGGSDPDSLYRLLVAGIAGTPMPGLLVTSEPGGVGVTSDQVWDLVAFLETFSSHPTGAE